MCSALHTCSLLVVLALRGVCCNSLYAVLAPKKPFIFAGLSDFAHTFLNMLGPHVQMPDQTNVYVRLFPPDP